MGAALAAVQNSNVNIILDYQMDATYTNSAENFQVVAINKTEIHHNIAQGDGGGVYLVDSKIFFGQETDISHNQANNLGGGGGIFTYNSFMTINSIVWFKNNEAHSGGGISLTNSKLYDVVDEDNDVVYDVNFLNNKARYGGAIFVNDESEDKEETCSGNVGCFFENVTTGLTIKFKNNSASPRSNGGDLYGGLLDRCSVVGGADFSEPESGASRFKRLTNLDNFDTVSSKPVRICICKNGSLEQDCSQRQSTINIQRGTLEFQVSLAAVDQVNKIINARIESSFKGSDIYIHGSQAINSTECADVTFQTSVPDELSVYELWIYVDGPCGNGTESSVKVNVNVEECQCPPGFMPDYSSTDCDCQCDEMLSEKFECNFTARSIIKQNEYWLGYLNDSKADNSSKSPFFYHCPLDYCKPPNEEIVIQLSKPYGEDDQCANSRSGFLCSHCKQNYSLSLASSKCVECACHDDKDKCCNWICHLVVIIIGAVIAGVLLVLVILVLNLTVAVGTLNSIVFYANIINANQSIYFGQIEGTDAAAAFISWLNLDIGIDTCFFETMDTYHKTLLQLAFPVYIIFIVIVIIILSYCSSKFSNLIGKKNPAATLATLILVSYTKLLKTIITSFSFANLTFPNGTNETRWLPDANVEYANGKHLALICISLIILIVGLLYTALVFSWQWLFNSPNSKIFKWTKNQKLHNFIDTYHKPYKAKHRYWTGLLLLVRVVVYVIAAVSISSDPRITFLSTAAIMSCLYIYKTVFMIRVYKNWLLNAMESFVYFNIIIFTISSWFIHDYLRNEMNNPHLCIPVYICVGTIIILFLIVIIFHLYRYGSATVYSMGQQTKLAAKINAWLSSEDENTIKDLWSRSRNTYRLFSELDEPRNKQSHHPSPKLLQTSTVVSIDDCDEAAAIEGKEVQKEISNKPRAKTQIPKDKSVKSACFSLLIKKTSPKLSIQNETAKFPLLEDEL